MSVAASALELRSVMIATDFSQASEKPLPHAVAIARTLLPCCGNNLAPNDGLENSRRAKCQLGLRQARHESQQVTRY